MGPPSPPVRGLEVFQGGRRMIHGAGHRSSLGKGIESPGGETSGLLPKQKIPEAAGRGLYPRGGFFGLSQAVLGRRPSKGGPIWGFIKAGLTTIRGFTSQKMARAIPSTDEAAPSTKETAVSPTYEDALAELERLVAAMEGGQLPLDKLLESYKRGAQLLSFCRARLEAVEQQVKVLEDGELKPWTSA